MSFASIRSRRIRERSAPSAPPLGKAPPWLISFGDMMTLFLCFFVMLVTLARTRDAGLMASGLGPFVAALKSHGMGGALDDARTLASINDYRTRFGLRPLSAADQRVGAAESADETAMRAIVAHGLRAYSALELPLVATFETGSAELGESARRYLDLLAETLRPGSGQVLVLEGHAEGDDARLASMRAKHVKDWLERVHGFTPMRVEARAWAHGARELGSSPAGVDARLVQPLELPEG